MLLDGHLLFFGHILAKRGGPCRPPSPPLALPNQSAFTSNTSNLLLIFNLLFLLSPQWLPPPDLSSCIPYVYGDKSPVGSHRNGRQTCPPIPDLKQQLRDIGGRPTAGKLWTRGTIIGIRNRRAAHSKSAQLLGEGTPYLFFLLIYL